MTGTGVTSSPWLLGLPNALSALRLGLAVAFPLADAPMRAAMVVGAGTTDFADGAVARRYGAAWWFGGLLDATADKAFVVVAVVTLTVEGVVEPWQAVLLLVRDAVVAVLALASALLGRWDAFLKMEAGGLGKWATTALFAFLLLATALPDSTVAMLGLFAVAAALSLLAAGFYILRSRRLIRRPV